MARPIKTKEWYHKRKKPVLIHFLTFELDANVLEDLIKKNKDIYDNTSHFCRTAIIYMAKHRHNVDLIRDRVELIQPPKESELVKKFKEKRFKYSCQHPDYPKWE